MNRTYIAVILVFCLICFLPTAGMAAAPMSVMGDMKTEGTRTYEAAAPAAALIYDDDDAYFDDDYIDVQPLIYDPLQPWNNAWFHINDTLYLYVAHPLASGYTYIMPEIAVTSIDNVFTNALFPVRFVNNLLQGKFYHAGVEFSSFFLNTTVGLGGIIDVASRHKPLVPLDDKEDFGQTLGVWGMGEGFYLIWPLLGPSTARDSIGMVGDYFLDPLTYINPSELGTGLKAARGFNSLDRVLDQYQEIKRSSIDPYPAMRDIYVQYRRAQLLR